MFSLVKRSGVDELQSLLLLLLFVMFLSLFIVNEDALVGETSQH